MRLKLRNRIALYYMLSTAILIIATFAVIYIVVYDTVFNHLDSDLMKEAQEVQGSIAISDTGISIINPEEWYEIEHRQIEVNPVFIQISDAQGNILSQSKNLIETRLSVHPFITSTYFFDASLAHSPVRQVQIPLLNQFNQAVGFVQVALPLEESELVINNLLYVLLFVLPFLLIALFFITRVIAGSSIEPIHAVIRTSERITMENISERIPLPPHRDEIYRLTSTINSLISRLETALQHEQQFTADASHELRTPLAVIKGTLEVMVRKPREPEYYNRKISFCIDEVNRMSMLIEQLLLIARYDSSSMTPNIHTTRLRPSILAVIDRYNKLAEKNNITLNLNSSDNPKVKADRAMLDVILDNLISNALKYSNPHQNIDITFSTYEFKTACTITDYGAGLPPDQVKRVFDRFYRANYPMNTNVKGSGLGLAIVKKMADLQNFEVQIDSEEGKYTRFTLFMPTV